jgi:hypothetical protein
MVTAAVYKNSFKGEINMDSNNEKFQKQFSEKNVFVDELIHQNIKLTNQNIGLIIDNNELMKRAEELETTNKRLRIGNLEVEGDGRVVIIIGKK